MKLTYKTTIFACFVSAVVQAVIVNFAPLLFLTFQSTYHIPITQITLLIAINFGVQLCVDFLSAFFVDKIGYRVCVVTAQFAAAVGLVGLAVLPEIMSPFAGLLIAVITYAIGGGLIEVLASPIVESCPTDNKEKAMSLMHSFYCWGHVGVVLLSTAFFTLFGIENWGILACIWALVPLINGLLFLKVPIVSLIPEGQKGMTVRELFTNKRFWIFVLMMLCSGAVEQSICQWTSAFAEQGLGVSKTVGDLAGLMAFATLMGTARGIYGKFGEKLDIEKFMGGCAILCVISYLMISLAPWPVVSLFGCAICGFSVGIMWPGTLSKASVALPAGGTAMFALLALAGDVGCSAGPSIVGFVSDGLDGNMRMGIFAAILFPILMLFCLLFTRKKDNKKWTVLWNSPFFFMKLTLKISLFGNDSAFCVFCSLGGFRSVAVTSANAFTRAVVAIVFAVALVAIAIAVTLAIVITVQPPRTQQLPYPCNDPVTILNGHKDDAGYSSQSQQDITNGLPYFHNKPSRLYGFYTQYNQSHTKMQQLFWESHIPVHSPDTDLS